MSDVENMALIMSKSSKTVADLKVRFPSLQEGMKGLLSSEMEMVVRAEKFLKEEPERLESALKRCKKLTSTLVTLKRLASVQEQRLPNAAASIDAEETPPITPTSAQHSKVRVEHMERQLANLTGLVQKALTHAPHTSPSPRDYLQVPAGRDPYARGPVSQPAVTDDSYLRTDVKPPKLGKGAVHKIYTFLLITRAPYVLSPFLQ
uniref:Coiled-coil domain-containing protein n=1 Tax=Apis cerana TaxID=7461 RepID=V9IA63_APICE